MLSHQRIRIQGFAVVVLGFAFLAMPGRAVAKTAVNVADGCAVCYDTDAMCADGNSDDLDADCIEMCGSSYSQATECTDDMEYASDCYPANYGSSMVRCYYTGG